MAAVEPGFARILAWRENMGDVYTGEWVASDDQGPPEAKEYVLAEVLKPEQPGAFDGDIYFGDPAKPTLGTHRWSGGEWRELPTEMEAVLGLLAQARARIAQLQAWQPESTAPRDGREVLILEKGGRRRVARFASQWGEPGAWYVNLSSAGDFYPTTDVIGWIPLPEQNKPETLADAADGVEQVKREVG